MFDSFTQNIADNLLMQGITSSTNTSPIEITKNNHGLATGDVITINGHATNTAANGKWVVTRTGANTFTLDDSVGNGIGGATGCFMPTPSNALVKGYNTYTLTIETTDSANCTIKFVSSLSEQCPDFGKPASPSNSYRFVDVIDTSDGSSIDGATGVVLAGTDVNKAYDFNIDQAVWIGIIVTAASAGRLTSRAQISKT